MVLVTRHNNAGDCEETAGCPTSVRNVKLHFLVTVARTQLSQTSKINSNRTYTLQVLAGIVKNGWRHYIIPYEFFFFFLLTGILEIQIGMKLE
jgi:hypothetical protein